MFEHLFMVRPVRVEHEQPPGGERQPAMEAGLDSLLFWSSFAVALAVWVAVYPVNYYLLRRGKGHALVHAHHSR